ncbi:MAG: DJ-1/PfpI family protein [Rikenellaceae bacterium]|nr:DJ-1/PfpI family protein [Rikenellaceae bacterium]
MAKKTAVLAVNPVNGSGLFQYLESFYENNVPFTVFAVADTKEITTNSGIELVADKVIADLKGIEDEYEALVFACGDAMPMFNENADKKYNRDLMEVISVFGKKKKFIIGHCVGGLLFDLAGIAAGKKLALHPFVKSAVNTAVATDEDYVVDGNFFTAKNENSLNKLIDKVVDVLK